MIKTYEEFNWNPFKKEYNDYLGLDDINALDEFNEIAGNRYENIVKRLLEKDGIKFKSPFLHNNSVIKSYFQFWLKNFYGDWVLFGFKYPGLCNNKFKLELKNTSGYFIAIKNNGFFLRKLTEKLKKIIMECFNDMDDEDYNESMKEIKECLMKDSSKYIR